MIDIETIKKLENCNEEKIWKADIVINSDENLKCFICNNEIKANEVVYLTEDLKINCCRDSCMRSAGGGRYPKIFDFDNQIRKAYRVMINNIKVVK